MGSVDCIYIAASAHDARYTRICVASIRFFYPQVPIRLLVGGRLQRGLVDELRKYWNVGTTKLIPSGDYGWGFVKLEPLFGTPGERFLVLDSDTAITGPVFDLWGNSNAPFLVDDETQPEAEIRGIYYDWQKVRELDPEAQPPHFLFNTGQWFGTAGILTRNDFAPWLTWTFPRKTVPSGYFMNGEQGLLNYVLNQKAGQKRLQVERRQIMRWPAHSMQGLEPITVSLRVAVPRVVHWAGLKKARQRDMLGGDLLALFEQFYYDRLPGGTPRRIVAGCGHVLSCRLFDLRLGIRLKLRKYASAKKVLAGNAVAAVK